MLRLFFILGLLVSFSAQAVVDYDISMGDRNAIHQLKPLGALDEGGLQAETGHTRNGDLSTPMLTDNSAAPAVAPANWAETVSAGPFSLALVGLSLLGLALLL